MPRLLFYSVTIFLLGLTIALRIAWQKPNQVLPRNQHLTMMVTVKTEPKIAGSKQVIEAGDGRVYVDLFPRYRIGDRLKIEGEVDGSGNVFNARVEKVGINQAGGFSSFWQSLRSRLADNVNQLLPVREATLVGGTVLGVDNIERSFKDELVKTGTIHVVVVSGQNLTIVAGVFISLARYIGRRQSLFLATLAVFAYALLTGFEPPVVRAGLMVLAATLAVYFGRQSWPIWNLLVAALVIVFIWPSAIKEISFQLTFAATLGIMTLGQWLSKIFAQGPVAGSSHSTSSATNYDKVILNPNDGLRVLSGTPSARATLRKNYLLTLLIDNAAVATSAYVFTTPIILYYFGKVSLLAPLANILVAEAVAPIMILGFLVVIASLILMPLAQLLAYFAYVPAFYFVKVVEVFAQLPVEQVNFGKGNPVFLIAFYILIFSLMGIWSRKSKVKSQKSKVQS